MPELAQKYTLTWKVTPDLLGILNTSGKFENTNPAWFKTLGLLPEEIESRQFFEFVHPDDMRRTLAAFKKVKSGRPVLGFENRYRHKDGHFRWLSWNAVPEGGRFYCSARDITEHKEAVEALQVTAHDARLREQFIAVLGHDLRNPLAAIASAIRILRRDEPTDKTLEILEMTQGSVDRMAGLIDDVMDFARSRLGSGMVLDRRAGALVRPALNQAIGEIEMARPGVEIMSEFDFDDPVDCDVGRVSQLFSNLLSNAVTHGDADKPIRVRAVDEAGKFVLSVANSGAPIPEKALKLLFQPFFRASVAENKQGLGLGLYIASEIARAHGGSLSVASDAQETVFRFEMPRDDSEAEPDPAEG